MKRAILRMTDELLMTFFTDAFKQDFIRVEVKNRLPMDAEIVGSDRDITTGILSLVIESEKFEDLLIGEDYPELKPPKFKTIFKE